MKPKNISLLVALILLFNSCKTYQISVDSFRQQFAGLSPTRKVTTKLPWAYNMTSTYNTYPLGSIVCINNKGQMVALDVTPALEIRFTDNNNRKTTFYFDLMSIRNDTVTGGRSRFIPSLKKSIPLSTVKTIVIQDGRKRYSYTK